MERIPFVKEEHGRTARAMESSLQNITEKNLILFVGVSVSPTIDEEPTYSVWVGCDRRATEDSVKQLVLFLLNPYLTPGASLLVEVRRGVSGRT